MNATVHETNRKVGKVDVATPDQATGIPMGNAGRIAVRKDTATTNSIAETPEATTGMPSHPNAITSEAHQGAGTAAVDSQTDVTGPTTATAAPAIETADAVLATIGYDAPLPVTSPDTQDGRTTETKEGNDGIPHHDVTHHVAQRDPE